MPKRSTPWQILKQEKQLSYKQIYDYIFAHVPEDDDCIPSEPSIKSLFVGKWVPDADEPYFKELCKLFDISEDQGLTWFVEAYEVHIKGDANRKIIISSPKKRGPTIVRPTPWNRLRKSRNYRVGDIAEYMGVTIDTVSSWMNGRTMPNTNNLATLCAMFSIRPEDGFAMAIDGCRMYNEHKKRRNAHQITFEEFLEGKAK